MKYPSPLLAIDCATERHGSLYEEQFYIVDPNEKQLSVLKVTSMTPNELKEKWIRGYSQLEESCFPKGKLFKKDFAEETITIFLEEGRLKCKRNNEDVQDPSSVLLKCFEPDEKKFIVKNVHGVEEDTFGKTLWNAYKELQS